MGNRGSYIATAHYQSRWRSSSFAQIGKWYYKYQWGSPDVCNEHRAGWVRTHWWEKIRSLPFIQCKNSIHWCLHDSLTIHSGMNIRFHIAFLSWVLVLNPEFDLTPIDKLHILQYGHFIRLSNPLLEYILHIRYRNTSLRLPLPLRAMSWFTIKRKEV